MRTITLLSPGYIVATGLLGSMLLGAAPGVALAGDALWDALTGGKPHLYLRYRYEHVDDNQPRGPDPEPADASTIRAALGYETGNFAGFTAMFEVEHVQEFTDNFNDGPGGSSDPGRTRYALVPDPEGTEVNQAFLAYDGIPDTIIKAGRQILTFGETPFHRYFGTVLWRQNWQVHDAVRLINTSLPDTELTYAYSWNVNRIFGEDAPNGFADFDSDTHIFNGQYRGLSFGKLEAFAYLIDLQNSDANSNQTYGARFDGKYPINESIDALYALEGAYQEDYGDNPNDMDSYYFLGEIGAGFKLANPYVKTVTFKFDYEILSGDGGADRFITPLATGHAFQGWADRFLNTPGDGIHDYYFSGILAGMGAKLITVYHFLESDNNDYDYGEELDVLGTYTFKEHYIFGLKYAYYMADENASNTTGPNAFDASIFWAFAELSF